jgi:PAS domain S-box-containing protein
MERSGAVLNLPVPEETAEELYQHAPCGYLSALPDGTVVRVNQTLLDWTGYTRESLLGKRLPDLLPVVGKIFYETHYDPLLRMQGFIREMALDLVCADGQLLPVLLNSVLQRDAAGRPVVVRTTVFDATERRSYERELLLARRRAEQLATIVEHGYSRIPVVDPDDPDRVVGMVYAKDLLPRVTEVRDPENWRDLLRPATFVPETKRCDELLRELREGTVHLALVVDEYGELVGLVTIEDLLEEIVGEIVDEHDHEEPLVELLDGRRLRIDARLGVDDLNELIGAELPEEGWDTVGGLVFGTLGRVPVEGETLELDGTSITVEQVQGRRVSKVVVERVAPVRDDER